MPLLKKDYYTFPEAAELIRGAFPEEDPEQNLLDVLRAGDFMAWIFDEKSKEKIDIPSRMWWRRDSDEFNHSFCGGLATMTLRGEGHDFDSILGEHYFGEVRVSKQELDRLLPEAADQPQEQRRATVKRASLGEEAPQTGADTKQGRHPTELKASSRRGRKKGTGSYAKADAPLVQGMKDRLASDDNDKPMSLWAAAMEQAPDAKGTASLENRAKRLVKRFKVEFR